MGQREYRLLLNIIDHLPRNSAYVEAIAQDEDLVDEKTARQRSDSRPTVREWSAEYELLVGVYNRLGDLLQAQVDKQLHLKGWPTPITAVDRINAILAKRQYESISAQLFPHAHAERR